MEGYKHLLVTVAFCFGMLIGNTLIDLDHSGSWMAKFKSFFKFEDPSVEKGVLHDKTIMLGAGMLFIGVGVGIIIHYLMDFT